MPGERSIAVTVRSLIFEGREELTHILHLEKWMSKPQLSARGIKRSILSKRRDTTI